MKKYQEPQAHHWIAMRLMRGYVKTLKTHNRDCFFTVMWLLRELGVKQVNHMLEQIEKEEAQ